MAAEVNIELDLLPKHSMLAADVWRFVVWLNTCCLLRVSSRDPSSVKPPTSYSPESMSGILSRFVA